MKKKSTLRRAGALILALCLCFASAAEVYGASYTKYTDRTVLLNRMSTVFSNWNKSTMSNNKWTSYQGATQCAAFSRYMFMNLYGHTDTLANSNVVKYRAAFNTVTDVKNYIQKYAIPGDSIRISSTTGSKDISGSETITHIFSVKNVTASNVTLYESNYGTKNKAQQVTRTYSNLINSCVNKSDTSARRKCSGDKIVNKNGKQAYVVVKILHSKYNQANVSLSLSASSLTMVPEQTLKLTAATAPSGQAVTWSSSNTAVATVSGGTVTAKAAGTAVISAKMTYNGKTYTKTCTVSVVDPSLSLSASSLSLTVGQTSKLTATTAPSGQAVMWSSSNTAVATVSGGTVTAKSAGTALITVKYACKNNKTYTKYCFVVVKAGTVNPAVSLSSSSMSMMAGTMDKLTAATTPSGQAVTWTSSNTSVATVSGGTVTAMAAGTAKITASFSYGGKTYSASCSVTVKSSPVRVEYPIDSTYLKKFSVTSNNAVLVAHITKPAGSKVNYVGLVMYNHATGAVVCDKTFPVTNVSASTTSFHAWFNVQKELSVTLSSGTTYKYRIYTNVDSVKYVSPYWLFTTK